MPGAGPRRTDPGRRAGTCAERGRRGRITYVGWVASRTRRDDRSWVPSLGAGTAMPATAGDTARRAAAWSLVVGMARTTSLVRTRAGPGVGPGVPPRYEFGSPPPPARAARGRSSGFWCPPVRDTDAERRPPPASACRHGPRARPGRTPSRPGGRAAWSSASRCCRPDGRPRFDPERRSARRAGGRGAPRRAPRTRLGSMGRRRRAGVERTPRPGVRDSSRRAARSPSRSARAAPRRARCPTRRPAPSPRVARPATRRGTRPR